MNQWAPSANKWDFEGSSQWRQMLKTWTDLYKQQSNLHMVLTFSDHHNACPQWHHLNSNAWNPDFETDGCSVAHFRWAIMSSWGNTLKIDSDDLRGSFAAKGREEHLRCHHFLSGQLHLHETQVQQLYFQMRRDCSEHLQQESYMLAVGLDSVEMLRVPLCGAQSHSA